MKSDETNEANHQDRASQQSGVVQQRLARPTDARVCKDCTNLVTTDATCPLCNKPTEPHPDRNQREGYCMRCGDGPTAATSMHLITWNEDPYMQLDDGDLILSCRACVEKEAEEEFANQQRTMEIETERKEQNEIQTKPTAPQPD